MDGAANGFPATKTCACGFPELMTLPEAAKRSRLCVKSLRRAIDAGRLKAYRPTGKGGKILISVEQLVAWFNAGLVMVPAPIPYVPPPPRVRPYVSQRYMLGGASQESKSKGRNTRKAS